MTTTHRIWSTRAGRVCLRDADEITGDDVIREFYVAVPYGHETGYVWEIDDTHHNGRRQVCDGLAHLGNTLRSTEDGLTDLIRREYRRAVAAERRARNY